MKRCSSAWLFRVLCFCLVLLIASIGIGDHMLAQRRTLYWGTTGQDVRDVQYRLRQWGYYDGLIDGYFGASTSAAVRDFQAKNGLAVDGIVGPQTWQALGLWTGPVTGSTASGSSPPANYSSTTGVSRSNDVQLLARLIHAEAQAEPYLGKVAVGAVVLNRVNSPSFPNTLSGVIYQPKAFESVTNGRVNLTPSEESVRAAVDALNGWDPTYGALYFWNPYKKVSAWIWSRPIITQIGQHVFGR
ncbi:MAG: spore cortex-lytic enzyme [Bacillota bacterium]|jgi:N-acetylmuramoyl-L-alanine amidase|nr:spore cortex-lytic enzyme [Bacillota bacterium]HOB91621.1 spore cortex-lytic enzyme [Bacillota bacterium]